MLTSKKTADLLGTTLSRLETMRKEGKIKAIEKYGGGRTSHYLYEEKEVKRLLKMKEKKDE